MAVLGHVEPITKGPLVVTGLDKTPADLRERWEVVVCCGGGGGVSGDNRD